jgi:SLT domain-containing protein
VWNGIKTEATTLWNAISSFFSGAWNALSTLWSNIWNGIKTAFSNVWNDIKSTAQSVWDGITSVIKTGVNGVIDAINWFIGKTDGSSGVNAVLKFLLIPTIPNIPRMEIGGVLGDVQGLAAGGPIEWGRVGGGFVTDGPKAIVGEGRAAYPEYVIPTDPQYRSRAVGLYNDLGSHLMASGGVVGQEAPGGVRMMADGGIIGWIGDAAGSVWHGITAAASAIAGAISDVTSWVGDKAAATLEAVKSAVHGMLPAGPVGQIGGGAADKVITAVQALISKKYAEQQAAAAAAGGGTAVPAGPIVQVVQQTAAQFGWGTGAEWAAIEYIVSHESGWNPTAQNPTSTAYGLFQFLDGTWASTGIAKTSDPSLQALAGMRYIGARYGDPINAQAYWAAHHSYDSGGWLQPGTTLAVNATSQPEAILTAFQWKAIMQLVDRVGSPDEMAQLVRSIGGGTAPAGQTPDKVSQQVTAQVTAGLQGIQESLGEKLDAIAAELKAGALGPITQHIHDQSGDPSETARTSVLMLRLRR